MQTSSTMGITSFEFAPVRFWVMMVALTQSSKWLCFTDRYDIAMRRYQVRFIADLKAALNPTL